MSFYGLFYNGIAITPNTYLSAWFVNFIAALPLNFLIVEPIARFILVSDESHTPVAKHISNTEVGN
ncbi:hypothetical protein [Streptococcus pneumoniae]|uniref:hypothetical protein n=1 Tax=Streptococcus pneumoniae TaxID=1313 RepID=UPI00067CC859|nr:hypothetical protein [Streptococcus pneumoniae]